MFYWWGNENKTNEATCLRPIAGKLHNQTWTEDWLQSPWFLISMVCCQQRGESRSRWQVQSRNFPWEEQKGKSGSILGLTSALFFNILVYICWHKRLSTAGTCLALERWVLKAQPLPTGAHPSSSGENPNNWTHMQHWAEYKFNFPMALPIQSSLLSFLFITPYFSFLTSYFSFWLELSWKWNFSGGGVNDLNNGQFLIQHNGSQKEV